MSDADQLTEEVFGPILHVVRYPADRLDRVLRSIERTGYGLTLGIHSRIDDTVEAVIDRLSVGNVYVNRNMIGAVVGVQPFGGHGLSGTGPKAGGPALSAAVCDRTDRDHQHRGRRRQRRADVGWGVNVILRFELLRASKDDNPRPILRDAAKRPLLRMTTIPEAHYTFSRCIAPPTSVKWRLI